MRTQDVPFFAYKPKDHVYNNNNTRIICICVYYVRRQTHATLSIDTLLNITDTDGAAELYCTRVYRHMQIDRFPRPWRRRVGDSQAFIQIRCIIILLLYYIRLYIRSFYPCAYNERIRWVGTSGVCAYGTCIYAHTIVARNGCARMNIIHIIIVMIKRRFRADWQNR